jgi:hypothetical protein
MYFLYKIVDAISAQPWCESVKLSQYCDAQGTWSHISVKYRDPRLNNQHYGWACLTGQAYKYSEEYVINVFKTHLKLARR